MTLSLKLGLLALVSTAAAAPNYGHGRFHSNRIGDHATGTGKAYPTGGWGYNSTTVGATGTGVASPSSEVDTTITSTIYSTTTEYSTIYRPKSKSAAVNSNTAEAVQPSQGIDPSEGVCGPATVTVTATDRVTVTVPASVVEEPTPVAPSSTPQDSAPLVPSSTPQELLPVVPSTTPEVVPSSVAVPSSPEVSAPVTSTPVLTLSIPDKGVTTPAPSSSATTSSAPASSTKPSGSPSYSGAKRGISYNSVDVLEKFSGGRFGWVMNWGQLPGDWGHSLDDWSKLNGASFIPMMHNPKKDGTPSEFAKNVATCVKQGSTAVMAFNEVDHPDQALMTPGEACSYWKQFMEPVMSAHPELAVIGPSVTNGPPPMGLDWLDRFAQECPSAQYHITNIHFYDIYNEESATIPKGTAQRFIDHVKKAISTYGKPVFVSEFGISDGTEEQAAKFLKTVMEWMDGEANVKGYAYFMAKEVPHGLIKSNKLSTTGEVYVQ